MAVNCQLNYCALKALPKPEQNNYSCTKRSWWQRTHPWGAYLEVNNDCDGGPSRTRPARTRPLTESILTGAVWRIQKLSLTAAIVFQLVDRVAPDNERTSTQMDMASAQRIWHLLRCEAGCLLGSHGHRYFICPTWGNHLFQWQGSKETNLRLQ